MPETTAATTAPAYRISPVHIELPPEPEVLPTIQSEDYVTAVSELVDEHDAHEHVSFGMRAASLAVVVIPFLGLIAAIVTLWGYGFGWLYLGLLVVGYILTGLGITVGFHRLATHKAFETGPVMKVVWTGLGSMAAQGPVVRWAAIHRRHHQHSDRHDDPHSPHTSGDGLKGLFKGIVHSHLGWLLRGESGQEARYAPDLLADPVIRKSSNLFFVWVALGLLIPTVIAGVATQSWVGAFLGFLWGGLVRVFLVHHVTWSINSVCHLWGSRPFRHADHSRNNLIFGILAFGEGWHNNHHAFPSSARHGLGWWQLDTSYLVIRTMSMLGLARKVRVPTRERIEAKRRGLE